ncbi:NADH dehydrogenase [Streptomyces abyssalis]|uniref:NADH dehydrogenase n=1 Tax=Streptomyces abyssalis TaxID=933944 RepID=A0A1E7JSA8_9ACTN|nr:2Fe-2S iron-sulfur cluster-binding protein [Streptomyces abyssalis]OEU91737.1 NADH dehydrogenase [Streptomyces abyssalis]OEU94125.1 NADH dehydrogenase [Streptomyces abyssalis]OEV26944.1 NADH dehydrogenase [Streptomyces nanshensis]
MTAVPLDPPRRLVEFTLDGEPARVAEGATILDACRAAGKDIPTLCQGETLEPKNACRACVVEVEGARTLAPACSRKAEPGMTVSTDTERARHSRKIVLELLASATDLSTTPRAAEWIKEYGAKPDRFGADAATMNEQPKIDNDLYVRDYDKCILCYKCVDACGEQWQNSFAISVAGRGFDARISTEHDAPLTDSACVYCGNCIEVCPTGALSFKSEFDMREAGTWDEDRQTETTTVCAYCGVGCNLTLHVQDNEIVKVSSPLDNPVTHGNLCIKGRFGYQHVGGGNTAGA